MGIACSLSAGLAICSASDGTQIATETETASPFAVQVGTTASLTSAGSTPTGSTKTSGPSSETSSSSAGDSSPTSSPNASQRKASVPLLGLLGLLGSVAALV